MLHLRLKLKNRNYEEYLEDWAARLNVSVDVLLARIVEAMAEDCTYCEKAPDWVVHPKCRKRQRGNRKCRCVLASGEGI